MTLAPHDSQLPDSGLSTEPMRRWRPVDVAILVAVACYGAAMLVVAAGLFARLAR
jgi:hypothetical protein